MLAVLLLHYYYYYYCNSVPFFFLPFGRIFCTVALNLRESLQRARHFSPTWNLEGARGMAVGALGIDRVEEAAGHKVDAAANGDIVKLGSVVSP